MLSLVRLVIMLTKAFARMRNSKPNERSFHKQLYFGLAVTFGPPAGVGALYLYASTTGCSGGDCTGAMLLVGMLGLAAVATTLTGLVWLSIILLGKLIESLRRNPAC